MSSKQVLAMVRAIPSRRRVRTFADLLAKLGDIAPDRVLLDPAPGYATEQDLLRFVEVDRVLCELVDGVLVEKPMGWSESSLAIWLASKLREYLNANNLGDLGGADSLLRLASGLVRLPDVAFVFWENMPDVSPLPSILDLAPDLAVEIISDSNTPKEMTRKRKEYFKAGTSLVWQVYPKRRSVEVFTSPSGCHVLTIDDVLDGGDLLPGFRLPLRTLFGQPTKQSRRPK